MHRRELIRQIAMLTGAAVAGSELFLSGCKNEDARVTGLFTQSDVRLFDEIAETILPKTDTPGAREAGVGPFMAAYATDCYDQRQLTEFRGGIAKLNAAAKEKFSNSFIDLKAEQKQELLEIIDGEARNAQRGEGGNLHYFTFMKQLVLLGFFTSKPGATQVLRYNPVPGKYHGCIDYKKGETAWA